MPFCGKQCYDFPDLHFLRILAHCDLTNMYKIPRNTLASIRSILDITFVFAIILSIHFKHWGSFYFILEKAISLVHLKFFETLWRHLATWTYVNLVFVITFQYQRCTGFFIVYREGENNFKSIWYGTLFRNKRFMLDEMT